MLKIKLLFCLFIIICFLQVTSQINSYLPKDALNIVVLLEKKIDSIYVPHGTGFLIQSYDKDKPVIVVTNEHVLRNKYIYVTVTADSALIKDLNSRGNIKNVKFNNDNWNFLGNKLRLPFELIPGKTFVSNKELDIAAFKIDIGSHIVLEDSNVLKLSNIIALDHKYIKYQKDVELGTEIFFIGFPFSIGTELGWFYDNSFTKVFSTSIPTPLVRKGIVAWKSPEYEMFLLDAFSYGGNSGSPILTQNDLNNKTYLIGIVAGHLPSTSSDNVGLARCIWIDNVMELIKELK